MHVYTVFTFLCKNHQILGWNLAVKKLCCQKCLHSIER